MTADFFRSTAAAVLAALIFTSCGTEVPDSQSMERRQAAAAAAQQVSAEATTAAVTAAATVPTTEAATEQFTLDVSVPEKYEMPVSCETGEVKAVMQKPELPTGCEITALTTLLNYLGFDVDKLTMADEFMPITFTGEVIMDEAYVGDPRRDGFGCNANVIVQAADKYFASVDSPCYGVDLTGTEFDDLMYQLAEGRPVLAWVTINLRESYPEKVWKAQNGKELVFDWYQHCVVLYGITMPDGKKEGVVKVADPLAGNVEYPYSKFKKMYEVLGKQAVVICGNSQTEGHHVTSEAEKSVTMMTKSEREEASQAAKISEAVLTTISAATAPETTAQTETTSAPQTAPSEKAAESTATATTTEKSR